MLEDSLALSPNRGTWTSKGSFVLASAGSAIGLGNIWRFPTQVGQSGGAVFVLLYLVCVFLICFPILIAEFTLGRRAQKDPVGSFLTIKPGTAWWLAGAVGVLAGAGILSFYAVIAGWTVAYVWFTATGAIPNQPAAVSTFFENFIGNGNLNLALTFIVLVATGTVIAAGVRSGIERATKTMMPVLFILLFVLAVRAVTLPGAVEGLTYYLKPDFTKLSDINVLSAALGQAFFSLSLGMGTMLTYGSYLGKKENIASAATLVVVLDTGIALLAGVIIFPSGFSIPNFDPNSGGPGLIFTVLPQLFTTLPGGQLFGASFFLLLTVAALTSAISLLEVPVAHLIDVRKWKRLPAVIIVTGTVFVLAVPSALANGAVKFLSDLPGLRVDFLSLMATVWNDFALPIGGLLTAIFVGHVWGVNGALTELLGNQSRFPGAALWGFLIRWVCPVGIASIILVKLIQ